MNSIVQRLARRMRYFLERRQRQQLLEEEMKFHIESVVEGLKATGHAGSGRPHNGAKKVR